MRKISERVTVGEWAGAAKQGGPAPDSYFLDGDHGNGLRIRDERGELSRDLLDECFFSLMRIPSYYARRARADKSDELLTELLGLYQAQGWSPPVVKETAGELFKESFGRGLDELLRVKRLQREREKAQQQRGRFIIPIPWW